jgi:hypothetical protein
MAGVLAHDLGEPVSWLRSRAILVNGFLCQGEGTNTLTKSAAGGKRFGHVTHLHPGRGMPIRSASGGEGIVWSPGRTKNRGLIAFDRASLNKTQTTYKMP